MKSSISLDSYECNGCGSCAEICPDIFNMNEAGDKALVLNPEAEITSLIEEAAIYCPAKCIFLARVLPRR